MTDLAAFIGAPVEFQHICLIYPPKIKDAVASDFPIYLSILTQTQDDMLEAYQKLLDQGQSIPTPLQYILINVYQNKEFEEKARNAFRLFTKSEVTFLFEAQAILFGDITDLAKNGIESAALLKEDNFFDFQNAIRVSVGWKPDKPLPPPDPDEDPRVRRIKEKARLRDRIKQRKGVKGGLDFYSTLVSICCMELGITPLNIGEMSYASISPIMKMYQDKMKYDLDTRQLLAGADSKKIHPKYWIRNLSDT